MKNKRSKSSKSAEITPLLCLSVITVNVFFEVKVVLSYENIFCTYLPGKAFILYDDRLS